MEFHLSIHSAMDKNFNTYSYSEKLEMERRIATEMSDDELAQILQLKWEKRDFPDVSLPEDEKKQLYANISSRIFDKEEHLPQKTESDKKPHVWRKIARYAAAVLLPVIVVASFYIYDKSKQSTEPMTIVSTERGERTSVTLPDGTEVNLNSASVLSYSPSSFADGKRVVDFEGEAFFKVSSDPSHPFMVKIGEVSVNVIGTEFNVFSRKDVEDVSVFLMKGKVEMLCEGVPDPIKIKPWQKAIFDKQNKEIEVIITDSNDNDIAWLNNELAFTNEPLEDVIKKIEISYGVDFDTQSIARFSKDRFTGTVPLDDISMVIDVLENVYDVKFKIKDKKIEAGS